LTCCKERARCRAVKDRVAHDAVVLAHKRARDGRPNDDAAAREPLAYIVIGIAEHLKRDALAEEGPERLPRGPAQADLDMALRKPCHAEALRDFGGKAGADGAVRVADIIGEL